MSFRSRGFRRPLTPSQDLDIAIIGAGFAGLGMAARLLDAGYRSVRVFDRASGVGGTWRQNSYPGCGCDVPSHLYSLSFAPSPSWTRAYARQEEILDYLESFAARSGVADLVLADTEIVELSFDEAKRWTLVSRDGRRFEADIAISAVGQLDRPAIPDLNGLATAGIPVFHSAAWRHDLDLAGRRVAVIGTGASAIQFVPELATSVERLHVFQRSANWVLPKPDRVFTARERARLASAWFRRLHRARVYASMEASRRVFTTRSRTARRTARLCAEHLERAVVDPDLRAKLTPDFELGCKRILISSEYYPAVARPNVEVITEAVVGIDGNTVVCADGSAREVDAVVFGTGFAATDFLGGMQVTTDNGADLAAGWVDGAAAYLGVAVVGFPNLFLLYGPNTNLAHNSVVFMLEQQMGMILRILATMRRRKADAAEVPAAVAQRFDRKLQRRMQSVVWATRCSSWYRHPSGRITNNWPSTTLRYWLATRVGGARRMTFTRSP